MTIHINFEEDENARTCFTACPFNYRFECRAAHTCNKQHDGECCDPCDKDNCGGCENLEHFKNNFTKILGFDIEGVLI